MKTLKIGTRASVSKSFTEDDVRLFAGLSMDDNPIHLDEGYAANTAFGRRIVHGFLAGSLISAVIGTRLPGVGTIYLSQTLNFKAPIFLGDNVTAEVTVIECRTDKPIAKLQTICKNQNMEIVLDGEAVVKFDPRNVS